MVHVVFKFSTLKNVLEKIKKVYSTVFLTKIITITGGKQCCWITKSDPNADYALKSHLLSLLCLVTNQTQITLANKDEVTLENILFPAHNVQLTKLICDLDQMNSICLYFSN